MSDDLDSDQQRPLLSHGPPNPVQFYAGIALIGVVVLLWNISGLLTQRIFGEMAFYDPLFVTIIGLSCFSLCHIPKICSQTENGTEPSSPRNIRLLSAQFVILWLAMCYTCNWSLAKTTLSSNTVLSSTSSVFTLIIAKFVMDHRISALKMAGVMATIAGCVIISFQDSSSSVQQSSLLGDLAALLSAAFCSLYTVTLTKSIGNDHHQISFLSFFGWMGQYVLWFGLPLLAILHYSHLHVIPTMSMTALFAVLLNGVISMMSDFLWAKSILLTSPLIATVGLSTSIPVAMIFDGVFNRLIPSSLYLMGSVSILFGFFLVNFDHLSNGQCQQTDDTPSERFSASFYEGS